MSVAMKWIPGLAVVVAVGCAPSAPEPNATDSRDDAFTSDREVVDSGGRPLYVLDDVVAATDVDAAFDAAFDADSVDVADAKVLDAVLGTDAGAADVAKTLDAGFAVSLPCSGVTDVSAPLSHGPLRLRVVEAGGEPVHLPSVGPFDAVIPVGEYESGWIYLHALAPSVEAAPAGTIGRRAPFRLAAFTAPDYTYETNTGTQCTSAYSVDVQYARWRPGKDPWGAAPIPTRILATACPLPVPLRPAAVVYVSPFNSNPCKSLSVRLGKDGAWPVGKVLAAWRVGAGNWESQQVAVGTIVKAPDGEQSWQSDGNYSPMGWIVVGEVAPVAQAVPVRVVDAAGVAVAGATVVAWEAKSGGVDRGFTDASGRVLLRLPAEGPAHVAVDDFDRPESLPVELPATCTGLTGAGCPETTVVVGVGACVTGKLLLPPGAPVARRYVRAAYRLPSGAWSTSAMIPASMSDGSFALNLPANTTSTVYGYVIGSRKNYWHVEASVVAKAGACTSVGTLSPVAGGARPWYTRGAIAGTAYLTTYGKGGTLFATGGTVTAYDSVAVVPPDNPICSYGNICPGCTWSVKGSAIASQYVAVMFKSAGLPTAMNAMPGNYCLDVDLTLGDEPYKVLGVVDDSYYGALWVTMGSAAVGDIGACGQKGAVQGPSFSVSGYVSSSPSACPY